MRVPTFLLLLLAFAAACVAPGEKVQYRSGDFALIEVQLQG